MVVLSLDIDFFVDPVAGDEEMESTERLSPDEYAVDSEHAVIDFLEQKCALSKARRVPGVFIRNHDQAFDVLRVKSEADGPITLIHVDAHADIGLGDAGYVYLLTQWLSRAAEEPMRGHTGLNLANWLAFAAGAGFVESVEFVPRAYPPADFLPYLMNAPQHRLPYASALTLRELSEAELDDATSRDDAWPLLSSKKVIRSVPWRSTNRSTFRLNGQPDFVVVCQSPQFTTASADRILELLDQYVDEVDLGIPLTRPL